MKIDLKKLIHVCTFQLPTTIKTILQRKPIYDLSNLKQSLYT